MSDECEHWQFNAMVKVGRLVSEKTGKVENYTADVTVCCASCGKPFQFLGLQPGMDTQGATVSLDGLEARLAISPEGVKPNPFHRMAYGIKSSN